MKAHIIEVSNDGLQNITVMMESAVGIFKGNWKSKLGPENGKNYSIELEIEPEIQIGQNASLLKSQQKTIQIVGDYIEIYGFVEGMDDDGVGYLRLDLDCLLMFGFVGDKIAIGEFLCIKIPFYQLGIYCY